MGSWHRPPDPVALLAAAVEAYEADLALVRAAFFASARRGRPENPETVGAQVHLEYRGARHRLRVDRTGPDTYRIHDGSAVDVTVDSLGDFERRLTMRRVASTESSPSLRTRRSGSRWTASPTS